MGKFCGCRYLENAGFAFVEILQFTIMFSLDKVIDSASMCHGSRLFVCQKNLSNMASSELSSTSFPIALEDEQSYGCHAVRHTLLSQSVLRCVFGIPSFKAMVRALLTVSWLRLTRLTVLLRLCR